MANMEADNNNEKPIVGLNEYVRKSAPPPFLVKTYMLVEDPATDEVISWNTDGTGFVVWQPAEFSRDLLPTLFKHSNFSSFVRQLNTYGFHKITTTRWEFCNDMFQKGKRELLHSIRRRKTLANKQQPQGRHQTYAADEDQRSISSTSSSSSEHNNNLIEENKRMKKENGALNSELTTMKRKCKELLDLVAKRNLEIDDEEDKRGLKLFGVRLMGDDKKKRKRVAK